MNEYVLCLKNIHYKINEKFLNLIIELFTNIIGLISNKKGKHNNKKNFKLV